MAHKLVLILGLVSLITAKDIRVFPFSACDRTFFVCLGLSSNQCCNVQPDTDGFGLTSFQVTDGSGVAFVSFHLFWPSACADDCNLGNP